MGDTTRGRRGVRLCVVGGGGLVRSVGWGWEGEGIDWGLYSSLTASYAKNCRFFQSVVISVLLGCNFHLPEMKKNQSYT